MDDHRPGASPRRLALGFFLSGATFTFGDKIWGTNFTAFLNGQGVSYTTIGLLYGALAVANASTDLVTGALADRFGRRMLAMIGAFLYAAGLLCYLMVPWEPGMLAGAVLCGLGLSGWSGSLSAWLRGLPQPKEWMQKVSSHGVTLDWVGSVLAGVAAYFALGRSGAWTFMMGAAAMAATGLTLFLLLPDNRSQEEVSIWRSIGGAVRIVVESPMLRMLTLASLVADVGFFVLVSTWQPLWLGRGGEPQSLSWLYIVMMVAATAGSALVSRFISRVSGWIWMIGACMCQAVLPLLALGAGSSSALVALLLFQFCLGMRFSAQVPLQLTLIPPDQSAAALSFMSTLSGVIGFVTFSLNGWVLDREGPWASLCLAGAAGALASMILISAVAKSRREVLAG